MLDALGRGQAADKAERTGSGLFEEGKGGVGAMSGGEHGIEEPNGVAVELTGEALKVEVRLEGGFIAGEAEVTDAGLGEDVTEGVEHAESRTEDGDEGDAAGEEDAAGGFKWGDNVGGLQG